MIPVSKQLRRMRETVTADAGDGHAEAWKAREGAPPQAKSQDASIRTARFDLAADAAAPRHPGL